MKRNNKGVLTGAQKACDKWQNEKRQVGELNSGEWNEITSSQTLKEIRSDRLATKFDEMTRHPAWRRVNTVNQTSKHGTRRTYRRIETNMQDETRSSQMIFSGD